MELGDSLQALESVSQGVSEVAKQGVDKLFKVVPLVGPDRYKVVEYLVVAGSMKLPLSAAIRSTASSRRSLTFAEPISRMTQPCLSLPQIKRSQSTPAQFSARGLWPGHSSRTSAARNCEFRVFGRQSGHNSIFGVIFPVRR
jgi:hypothetical protein